MNPDSTQNAFPILLEAVVGGAIGAFIAIAASLLGKRAIKFVPDLLLGVAGYLGGVALTPYLPWHLNTIEYRMGNAVIRSTSRHFQYPYRVGFAVAVLLPLIYELVRLFFERKSKTPAL
ncbi:MAG TPA: hypothetical protein VMB85_22965 [Bryobacteraceae bacterium]|jgi:hypothetical protein|nr:hypothetical protein [Bryobacteraceae bacterium]